MNGADRLGAHDADLAVDEVAALWSASGAAWLTESQLGAPVALVRRIVGLVEHLDRRGASVSSLVSARGVGLLAERAAAMGLPASGAVSAGGASRFLLARDGWLALSLARPEDQELLPAWLDGVAAPLEEAVGGRPVAELVERAVLLGLPCAEVDAVDGADGAEAVLVDRCGEAPPRPIAESLVVNLSALWAGPLCADLLARAGARLITVESERRPDGGRQARRFFAALHGRSESVALDLTGSTGRRRLARLIDRADVVIEGSRPRALEQMGIDARRTTARGGPQVWLSITAHGRTGMAARRVGFGDDAAAAGGLVGWIDASPRFVADAVADPLSGLTAAATVLELLDRGGRWMADVALARTARSVRPGEDGWVRLGDELERRPPRPRSDPGSPMPLGRDTERVIAEFELDEHDLADDADLG